MQPTTRALAWREWAALAVAMAVTTCSGEKGLTEPLEPTFATVSAGFLYSCGVKTGGAAYCWGGGSLVPVKVAGQP